MQIIPVIDLKDGQVVLARQGKRHLYRPLATPLCPASDIIAVADAYFSVFPFNTVYIADLDAIENTGDNHGLIKKLLARYPHIHLWIDSGLAPFIEGRSDPHYQRVTNVLGSETYLSSKQLASFMQQSRCILSLDYHDHGFAGNDELLADPSLLPARLIMMSLPHVGRNTGPDLQRLDEIGARAPGKEVYVAGGIGGVDDLIRLKNKGVNGVLLASALHNKSIHSASLEKIQGM